MPLARLYGFARAPSSHYLTPALQGAPMCQADDSAARLLMVASTAPNEGWRFPCEVTPTGTRAAWLCCLTAGRITSPSCSRPPKQYGHNGYARQQQESAVPWQPLCAVAHAAGSLAHSCSSPRGITPLREGSSGPSGQHYCIVLLPWLPTATLTAWIPTQRGHDALVA